MSRKYDLNARIVRQEELNESLRVITVAPHEGMAPAFTAGQYAELAVPPEAGHQRGLPWPEDHEVFRRPFSIASAPSQRDGLEFLIVLVDGGRFTSQLWRLQEGDDLWMGDRVKGRFTLDAVEGGIEGKNLVMVSTGTGLAPFVSMWRELRESRPWRKLIVVNGVRYARDLAYMEELRQGCQDDPAMTYVPTVSREDWGGIRARVTALFEGDTYEKHVGEPLSPENTHVFLCGNPAMIDQVNEDLIGRGFTQHKPRTPGNVHFERYW